MISSYELKDTESTPKASRNIDPLSVLAKDDFTSQRPEDETLIGRITKIWVKAGERLDEGTLLAPDIEVPSGSVVLTLTQFDKAEINPGQIVSLVGVGAGGAEIVCKSATVLDIETSSVRVIAPAADATRVLGYQGKDRKISFLYPSLHDAK